MHFFEKILFIDYSSYGFSSVEQLVFIKIAHSVFNKGKPTSSDLCASCACSKPTLHLSISRLEELGFITVARSIGCINVYSLDYSYIDSILPEHVNKMIELNKQIDDFNSPIPDLPKLTKNQRKRLNNKNKRRY